MVYHLLFSLNRKHFEKMCYKIGVTKNAKRFDLRKKIEEKIMNFSNIFEISLKF